MTTAAGATNDAAPYRQTAEEVVGAVGSDAGRGLTAAEARERLARDGPNELTADRPTPAWRRFLAQFQEGLVVLLLVAAGISFGLWLVERDAPLPYEALTIFAVVLLNATMGYVQHARAEAALAALRRMGAAHATVVRDGVPQRIAATDLVCGDVIVLEDGNAVPADARLIRSTALQTAEASLTGESLPVEKDPAPVRDDAPLGDRHNMVYSGTAVTYGRGRAVVVATGMRTEMGRIAGMLRDAPPETTPLQRELDGVGKLLGLAVVAIAIAMIGTILAVEPITSWSTVAEVLIVGVALAIAAVPEGLPAVVTVVLSLGVQRMARRNAIVRHLAAVETLGSTTVIASDKTGTLTRNEMTVRAVVTASGRVQFGGTGYAPEGTVERDGGGAIDGALRIELERTLSAADRATNAVLQEDDRGWSVHGDPTEAALIVAARKAGLEAEPLGARFARVAEVPFSSERKLMSTVHTDAERREQLRVFTKGAPDVLLARCSHELVGAESAALTADRRAQIAAHNERLAGEALRTLGVAFRSLPPTALDDDEADERLEHDLVFLGLIGIIDPPRAEAYDAVARTKRAGVRPILITGDHPTTAAMIAAELGIAEERHALTGTQLAQLADDALAETVQRVSVYARVTPEHKLRIVAALQAHGAIVAMTGDGVNDAPALKRADIGVAMGVTGTDVAKEAADVVLADDNFATIVAAVEEGRTIFDNIRKFLRFLLSSNIGEVLTMFLGVLFADAIGLRGAAAGEIVLPLLATQLLWINMVTDGAPALALGVDPRDDTLMSKPPRPAGERVITAQMWAGIIFVGLIVAAGTLLVLDASLPGGLIAGSGTMRYAQTMAFTTLVLFSLFNVFNARSDERSALPGLFANPWLWGAIALSILAQVAVTYVPVLQQAFSTVPLGAADWLRCVLVASSVLWLREASKLLRRALRPSTPDGRRAADVIHEQP